MYSLSMGIDDLVLQVTDLIHRLIFVSFPKKSCRNGEYEDSLKKKSKRVDFFQGNGILPH